MSDSVRVIADIDGRLTAGDRRALRRCYAGERQLR
jgi:hypothetical protein